MYVVLEFFRKNPEIGLLFICDTGDGYGRHRKITFSKWYRETKEALIEKFDCYEALNKEGFYTSILIRSDNPLKEFYVDALYRAIDAFFADFGQSVMSTVAVFQ